MMLTLTIGSSSAIFACGAAKLGLRTGFIGKVGNDVFGRFMIESLRHKGIDTTGIIIDRNISTGFSVILTKEADRAILTYMGSIPALSYQDINLDWLKNARHLHLGSYYLLDHLRPHIPELFHEARERGLTVSLDTNYDPLKKWEGGIYEALTNTDIFCLMRLNC
jgi:sugar/nucleoside kinase (ribokinase family)